MEELKRGGAGASGAEEAGGGREEGSGGASGAMEGVTEEGPQGGAGQAAPQAKKAPRPILKKEGAAPAQAARPKGRVMVVDPEATRGVITRGLGKPRCPTLESMSRFFH